MVTESCTVCKTMDWCRRGIWQHSFEVFAARPSLTTVSLDSTFVVATGPRMERRKKRTAPLGTVAAAPPQKFMPPSTAEADPPESD